MAKATKWLDEVIGPTPQANVKGEVEECAICLEEVKHPYITLPCKHKFCTDCFDGWRSRHGLTEGETSKSCPQCRERVPPSKEMALDHQSSKMTLEMMKEKFYSPKPLPDDLEFLETDSHPAYRCLKDAVAHPMYQTHSPEEQQAILRLTLQRTINWFESEMKSLEEQMDGFSADEIIEDTSHENYVELPLQVHTAASYNKIAKVLKWLGPKPIPKNRLDARNFEKSFLTLLDGATFEGHTQLMHILLQYGADVDPISALAKTPLFMTCFNTRMESAARLLLEWGAKIQDDFPSIARNNGSVKLGSLMNSPLGGRRCEIVGISGYNGRACVTRRYFEDEGKYSVKMEGQDGKIVKIKEENLKRRDRTPEDPGYTLEFIKFDGRENVVKMEWADPPVST